MSMTFRNAETEQELKTVEKLAEKIWARTYRDILPGHSVPGTESLYA